MSLFCNASSYLAKFEKKLPLQMKKRKMRGYDKSKALTKKTKVYLKTSFKNDDNIGFTNTASSIALPFADCK